MSLPVDALLIAQRITSTPVLATLCTVLAHLPTTSAIESSVYNTKRLYYTINSWMVPETRCDSMRHYKVVVANLSRRVYLYIPLRCVARTVMQLLLDGRFCNTDDILVMPRTCPHVPGFEHLYFATRIGEIRDPRVPYIEELVRAPPCYTAPV